MNSTQELYHILPLIIIASAILISLTLEMFSKRSEVYIAWISVLSFFASGYYALFTAGVEKTLFSGMIQTGGNVHIFYFIFNFGAAIVTLLSIDYIKKINIYHGEYYILLQSAVLGMMLISSAKNLIMIFVGLELMSICFYVLAGFQRKKIKSIEASLKYLLLGSFASGFLVYGIALIYGTAQSLYLNDLIIKFPEVSSNLVFVAGLLFFIIGFSFKIAAFPFHMWVPDVYQGAPTSVTSLMSTGGKAAAFSALLLILSPVINFGSENIVAPILAMLSIASMLYGSIVALVQDDLKRMLAYSSIAHAGYMIIGLVSGVSSGSAGIIFYLFAYTFMNLGAFGIISIIEGENDANLSINDYKGFANNNPLLAALLSLFMLALTGIPPFAGFFGKYYVFISAIDSGYTYLAILGVISSAISVYFYLRVTILMYFGNEANTIEVQQSSTALLGVVISALLVVMIGIFPGPIIDLISSFLI